MQEPGLQPDRPRRQVRPGRRRGDGLLPPPRRPTGHLRHARPPRPALLAALSARRRPGELRKHRRRSRRPRCDTVCRRDPSRDSRGTIPIDGSCPRPARIGQRTLDVLDRLGRAGSRSNSSTRVNTRPCVLRTREGFELTGTPTTRCSASSIMVGVPLLLWKLLEEIGPGDRVLVARTAPIDVAPTRRRRDADGIAPWCVRRRGLLR